MSVIVVLTVMERNITAQIIALITTTPVKTEEALPAIIIAVETTEPIIPIMGEIKVETTQVILRQMGITITEGAKVIHF
jgi:hypothetical protein|nr:MAG TPA_asm: hypothetical protein [Bacteriophage sp.]